MASSVEDPSACGRAAGGSPTLTHMVGSNGTVASTEEEDLQTMIDRSPGSTRVQGQLEGSGLSSPTSALLRGPQMMMPVLAQ